MTQPVYDKRDQYEKVAEGLLQGEKIIAVYDATGQGTGFIGITDRRVVLQDNSFVGRKVALTSLPYSRITSVSFVSDRSMLGRFTSTSQIALTVGAQTHEVEFRGHDKAKACHDAIVWHITR